MMRKKKWALLAAISTGGFCFGLGGCIQGILFIVAPWLT